jgi:hypothetical protein
MGPGQSRLRFLCRPGLIARRLRRLPLRGDLIQRARRLDDDALHSDRGALHGAPSPDGSGAARSPRQGERILLGSEGLFQALGERPATWPAVRAAINEGLVTDNPVRKVMFYSEADNLKERILT